jgi:hypothetical protein
MRLDLLPNRHQAPRFTAAAKLGTQAVGGHPPTGGHDVLPGGADLLVGDGGGRGHGGVLRTIVRHFAMVFNASQGSA